MNFLNEQNTFNSLIKKAWNESSFKEKLISNPKETIEKFLGRSLNLSNDKRLIVTDQTDNTIVYFNIPSKPDYSDIELTEDQLDYISGGGNGIKQPPSI